MFSWKIFTLSRYAHCLFFVSILWQNKLCPDVVNTLNHWKKKKKKFAPGVVCSLSCHSLFVILKKLYRFKVILFINLHTLSAFNQYAKSPGLAMAVDSPIILTDFLVLLLMQFILDTITSNTWPLSSPNKWISSMIMRPTSLTKSFSFQFLLMASHFSGVVMIILAERMISERGVMSPVTSTTFLESLENFFDQSRTLSLTKAFIGAM